MKPLLCFELCKQKYCKVMMICIKDAKIKCLDLGNKEKTKSFLFVSHTSIDIQITLVQTKDTTWVLHFRPFKIGYS